MRRRFNGPVDISANPLSEPYWPQAWQKVTIDAWVPGAPPYSSTFVTYQVMSPADWHLEPSGGPGVILPPVLGNSTSGWIEGEWVTVVVQAQVAAWYWVYYLIAPRRWGRRWEPYVCGVSAPLTIRWSAWFPT
jgi:hypothetical protein